MMGLYADWQPRYAAHGVATFPVRPDKTPAIKGYLRIGSKGSRQLAQKFTETDAFGLACKPNNITVLDVDTNVERVLTEGLDRYGQTPFIVRSGSGNYQAWYRNNGERRHVRPDPDKPIDILGDGFVVCPPSKAAKGRYEIIAGSLDDLDRLPKMRSIPEPRLNDNARPTNVVKATVQVGQRNQLMFSRCLEALAKGITTIEELTEMALHENTTFAEPLPTAETMKAVASAWGYHAENRNWFGRGGRVVFAVDEVDDLASEEPQAFALLSILRRHHFGQETFILANAMAESMGWDIRRFRAARDVLIQRRLIECIHRGGRGPNDPPVYRFPTLNKGGNNVHQY